MRQFFEEQRLAYDKKTSKLGETEIPVYTAKDRTFTIYCGDIFLFNETNITPNSFDFVLDHGAVGSFPCSKERRREYAKITASLTKPGGRVLLSFFDYIHAEHPSVPLAITEEEVAEYYGDYFVTPELLESIDAKRAIEAFGLVEGDSTAIFPIWELSRFAWKIVLLLKK